MPPGRHRGDSAKQLPVSATDKPADGHETRAPRKVTSIQSALNGEPADTRTRILDAAETLFIETGFSATSLRAIARRAEVNLAAPHYHFGSKEGLLAATIHRRIAPINEARVTALDLLEARGTEPSPNEILRAFFEPLETVDRGPVTSRLIGRLHAEPLSVSEPIIKREFGALAERFLDALARVLPDVPSSVISWRFHFAIGAMIQMLTFEKPVFALDPVEQSSDGLEQLIAFVELGLTTYTHPNLPEATKP
ncbi:MAG: AcrR family transcriptional regulator [Myxococcota bacterium]|jgi:AcrR family transcriptional regulator